jgi:hypothetical protein
MWDFRTVPLTGTLPDSSCKAYFASYEFIDLIVSDFLSVVYMFLEKNGKLWKFIELCVQY